MQFQTTVFSSEKQTVEGKTFQITTVEQKLTIVCDACGFALTGTKDDLQDWILIEEITLCGGCSY